MPWGAMQCTASINFDTAQEPLNIAFKKTYLLNPLKDMESIPLHFSATVGHLKI